MIVILARIGGGRKLFEILIFPVMMNDEGSPVCMTKLKVMRFVVAGAFQLDINGQS